MISPKLTQSILKELLDYDRSTGVFIWKNPTQPNKVKDGDIAGYITTAGYRVIRVQIQKYYAHRLAWLYVYGEFPKLLIDHINRNRDDNRICNLREATTSENSHNSNLARNNKSGYRGVFWCNRTKGWKAAIMANKKLRQFGPFESIEEANKVCMEARKRLHPFSTEAI